MTIKASAGTRTVKLTELEAILRSKDEKLFLQIQWIFQNEFKFLDGSPNLTNKIAFASFPRGGNTFMRKVCELLTGIQTGADNTFHFSVNLQLMGNKGEYVVDDRIWIAKTHQPWIMEEAPVFTANKIILVVRNPLDVVLSWLNLCINQNHHQKA